MGARVRLLTGSAAAGLLVIAGPVAVATTGAATGAPTASRSVQADYAHAGGVTVAGSSPQLITAGGWQSSRPPEDRVRVAVHDSSARPVAIEVDYQPRGGGGPTSIIACGATGTLAIATGSAVRVTPLAGSCPDGTASLPSSGSVAVTFVRPLPPPPPPTIEPAKRWAVVVGIQDYAGNTHPTFGGRGDAATIRAALLRAGWRSDHILSLVDAQASGQAILDAMSWLAARSGPGTFSLFHFSGHVCIASRGPCPSGHTYLWGQDNTFLSESSVAAELGRVSGRAWFDFAGCESGAFDAGLHSARRLVTGSSQASETSYESPDWHESVWTGLVWDRALTQGDAGPRPDRATIGQIVSYGQSQAPRVTANQAAGPQHPYVAGGDPTQTLYAPRP